MTYYVLKNRNCINLSSKYFYFAFSEFIVALFLKNYSHIKQESNSKQLLIQFITFLSAELEVSPFMLLHGKTFSFR